MEQYLNRRALLNALSDRYAIGVRPRVHGNGFIQIDLDDRTRCHVWGHPAIPRQTTPSPIHDHSFGFESICVQGRLVNVVYEVGLDNPAFEMLRPRVRKGEDTVLELAGYSPVSARPVEVQMLLPGDTYTLAAHVFHETFAPEPTVTVIRKDAPTQAQGGAAPNVLLQMGRKPDNEFDRYALSAGELIDLVEDILTA